jgi:hypothetical protein
VPAAMTPLHATMWLHEDYYVPITHANIFLGMEKKSIKYQVPIVYFMEMGML